MEYVDKTGEWIDVMIVHRSEVKKGDRVLWANLIVEVEDVINDKGEVKVILGDPVNKATNYMFYYVVKREVIE